MSAIVPSIREILYPATAITDTGAKTSASATLADVGDYQLVALNTLNQAGSIQEQMSFDAGTTWINVGAVIPTVASTSDVFTLAKKPWTALIRFVFTASVAPGSGTLSLILEKKMSV